MSSMLAASIRKSSSSTIVSPNSSTSVGGLASAATGMRPTRCGASHAITLRSLRTSDATVVRCTLTTTCFAGQQRRCVDLGDRRSSERGLLEVTEHVLEPGAEILLDRDADDVERLGLHLVAALLELGDELGGEQPVAGGDDLAELDVGGPERLGGDAQPVGDLGLAGLGVGELPSPLLDHPRCDRLAEVADDGDHAKARRQSAWAGEFGHLGLRLTPQGRWERRPADVVTVEHPWTVFGERTPSEIRRVDGLGRWAMSPRHDAGFSVIRRREATSGHDRTTISRTGAPTDRHRRARQGSTHRPVDRAARCREGRRLRQRVRERRRGHPAARRRTPCGGDRPDAAARSRTITEGARTDAEPHRAVDRRSCRCVAG